MVFSFIDSKQKTIRGRFLEILFSVMGYQAIWPVVPYCVERATKRLSIVGSP